MNHEAEQRRVCRRVPGRVPVLRVLAHGAGCGGDVMGEWSKRFIEHANGDGTTYLSVPFTWNLPDAYQRAAWLGLMGRRVIAGGPAVMLMPDYLEGVAEIGTDWPDAMSYHNPQATFTSRGCIRHCSFCAVWRTEGKLRELDDWPIRPIICDNNLLACSRVHFDDVIDKLKPLSWCDFNQGLDNTQKWFTNNMDDIKNSAEF